ncbi:MAG: hypothetical protein IPK10_17225 [Bacteroidetes bacterium]|nr:hypothetical protein [Bacteroidota bacterium]
MERALSEAAGRPSTQQREPNFALPMKKGKSDADCSVVAKDCRKQKLQKSVGVGWRAFFGYTDSKKEIRARILIVTLQSHSVPHSVMGVLSLVIPTLHINLSRGLRFIECKSVFHNFIYSCIKATPVSLSFHAKESNKQYE